MSRSKAAPPGVLLRMLRLRPGEGLPLLWVAAMGALYAAATSLGDDIAQSVFVTRVGARALPHMILCKGILDVVAAAVYVPLARGRSTGRVWRASLAIYACCVLGGWALAAKGGNPGAYALYVAHECAWTILTMHWGVLLLDTFDASQARRLFPLLFTAARLGGMAAGALLQGLAETVGAVNMLLACAALAGAAGALSLVARHHRNGARSGGAAAPMSPAARDHAGETAPPAGPPAAPVADLPATPAAPAPDQTPDRDPDPSISRWAGWRHAASSPLIRAIALSTAAMVLVRYGLHLVSLDTIDSALGRDEDRVAAFLGWFGAWANAAGALLGVLVVPRILARLGVGAANLTYAAATVVTWCLLVVTPALWSAALARFVNTQLKDALKTPLSTLFYGAEPPPRRAPARAFVFGAVIPAATVATAVIFTVAGELGPGLVVWPGLAAACAFLALCAHQNRCWRRRLAQLLQWKLARTPAAETTRLDEVRHALTPLFHHGCHGALMEPVARGLASPDARTRAVAGELLAELAPRRLARAAARHITD